MLKIAVIDTELTCRAVFQCALACDDIQIVFVDDWKEVVERAACGKTDCVIISLNPPSEKGIETIRLIKKTEKNMPIIVITEDIPELKKHAMENGADMVIDASLESEKIASTIIRILREGDKA